MDDLKLDEILQYFVVGFESNGKLNEILQFVVGFERNRKLNEKFIEGVFIP